MISSKEVKRTIAKYYCVLLSKSCLCEYGGGGEKMGAEINERERRVEKREKREENDSWNE